jgi:hypothetical protein
MHVEANRREGARETAKQRWQAIPHERFRRAEPRDSCYRRRAEAVRERCKTREDFPGELEEIFVIASGRQAARRATNEGPADLFLQSPDLTKEVRSRFTRSLNANGTASGTENLSPKKYL